MTDFRIENPTTVASLKAALDALYLKLDQTTPQTVSNGSPKFAGGLTIKAGQKLVLDG